MRSDILRRLAAIAATAWLAACGTTPGPVIVEDATAMKTGISAVREQSRTAFASANRLARDQAIEFQVRKADPLNETLFPLPVAQADADRWANDLGVLEAYAASLQKLASPDQAQATATALEGLGNQLSTGKTQLSINPTLQGLGVTLGKALVQAKASKAATEAMAKADPAVQDITSAMAEAIGARPAPGNLQQAVWANWLGGQLSTISAAYQPLTALGGGGKVDAGKTDDRRRLIKLYIAALEARDAQLRELTMLHDSLLALGQVHAAAARGKPGDAAYWVAQLNSWTDEIKAHAAAAKTAQDEANK